MALCCVLCKLRRYRKNFDKLLSKYSALKAKRLQRLSFDFVDDLAPIATMPDLFVNLLKVDCLFYKVVDSKSNGFSVP